jgi:hypothetical protein
VLNLPDGSPTPSEHSEWSFPGTTARSLEGPFIPWSDLSFPESIARWAQLLRRLSTLVAGSRHTEADLVANIGEVDARQLYLREATTIRKLPAGRMVVRKATQRLALDGTAVNPAGLGLRPEQVDSGALDGVYHDLEHRPGQVDSQHLNGLGVCSADLGPEDGKPRPDAGLVRVAAPLPRRATIEPLAPARFRVQFTASDPPGRPGSTRTSRGWCVFARLVRQ